MFSKSQRVAIVRPTTGASHDDLLPVQSQKFGDLEVENNEAEGGGNEGTKDEEPNDERPKLHHKVEGLQRKLAEHFEDEIEQQLEEPQVVKAPSQPTKERWARHRTTHVPYEAWCQHCVAARVVRRGHPPIRQRAHIVPDTDASKD